MRGSVVKKGNKWYIVYTIGILPNGKRKQKWESGFKTKREAETMLARRIVEVETNGYVEPSNVTIAAFVESWASDKQAQVRPSTWRSYDWHLRHHVLPHLGHVRLKDLKPPVIQGFYATLRKSPRADGRPGTISERSLLHVHLVLHSILQRALRWGYIASNPCTLVDKPRPVERELSVWTIEELQRFLDFAMRDNLYPLFLLLSTTGMRIGEVLGVRWSDVDFEENTITIRQQITCVKGGYYIGPPKTKAGKRTIDLNTEVMAKLLVHRTKVETLKSIMGQKFRRDLDLVFCSNVGTPLYRSNITKSYNRIIAEAGLKRIRIHDARHTHVTLLLEQRESLKTIQERIGHEKADVLLNTYGHLLPRTQRSAVDRFGQRLFNTASDDEQSAMDVPGRV